MSILPKDSVKVVAETLGLTDINNDIAGGMVFFVFENEKLFFFFFRDFSFFIFSSSFYFQFNYNKTIVGLFCGFYLL